MDVEAVAAVSMEKKAGADVPVVEVRMDSPRGEDHPSSPQPEPVSFLRMFRCARGSKLLLLHLTHIHGGMDRVLQ